MGTLQKQQDIHAESTRAHLNELSAAQEDLYKSLLNAESINTVTDIMTGLTEATTTWVDSLGGGIGVLKNLGALGTTVFSKQIAGGINNAISAMTRSSSNKKIIENAFNQAVNLQNITDNKYTKDIIEQQKNILKVSGVLKPEELKELQDAIDSLAPTANELNKVSQLRQEYEKIEQAVAKLDFDGASLEDSQNLEKVRQKLEEINREIDELLSKEINLGSSDNNWTSEKKIGVADTLSSMENEISSLSKRGLVSEDNLQSWRQAQLSFRSFLEQQPEGENFTEKAAQEYNRLAKIASDAFTDILEKAQETNNNIILDLQKDTRAAREDVASQEKDYADKLASDLKKRFDALDPKRRQQTIQGLVEVVGGIQGIGVAVQNFQQIGSIWKNNDLKESEKWVQTLSNLGTTAMSVVPSIMSMVTSLNALNATIPQIAILTTALSALVFIVPALIDTETALEKASNKLKDSLNVYEENVDKLKSLEDQLKNTNDRLKELYSIADEDLTIADQKEINNLEIENEKIKTQIKLQEELNKAKLKSVGQDAITFLNEKDIRSGLDKETPSILSTTFNNLNDTGAPGFYTPEYFQEFRLYTRLSKTSEEAKNSYSNLSRRGALPLPSIGKERDTIIDLSDLYEELVTEIKSVLNDIDLGDEQTKEEAKSHLTQLTQDLSDLEILANSYYDPNNNSTQVYGELATQASILISKIGDEETGLISTIDEEYKQQREAYLKSLQEIAPKLPDMIEGIQTLMAETDTESADYQGYQAGLKEAQKYLLDYYRYIGDINKVGETLFKNIDVGLVGELSSAKTEEEFMGILSTNETLFKEIQETAKTWGGLSPFDVFGVVIEEWGSFENFLARIKTDQKEVVQLKTSYQKVSDRFNLINQAQEQLSSKGTLDGWEQKGAFYDLLKESDKLEEWNNLLGYTSDEKIAWLEKYLNVSKTIKELEEERARALEDLPFEQEKAAENVERLTEYLDSLKERRKDDTLTQEDRNLNEAEIEQTEAALVRAQQKYDEIVKKIEELQSVDEETAKLILSEYDTVQKLNKARDDGIILEETYATLYNTVLQRQLESLGITQETFNAYKDLTGATDEMALNILTASQNMSAFKSALPSKEEFDFSALSPNKEDFATIATLYSSQIAGLGNLFSQIFGKNLTERAQKLLYQPYFLSLAQEGFTKGDEESLRKTFQLMASVMDGEASNFEGLIAQYVAGFQEFTDAQIALIKETVDGITDNKAAEQFLKQQEAFQSLMSIDLLDFKDANVSLTKYSEQISNLGDQLAILLGKEKLSTDELATLFDRENLINFQEGLEGNEAALHSFLDLFLIDAPEELKARVDSWITEWVNSISTISTELRTALMEAFGGNVKMVNEYVQGQEGYGAFETAFEPISGVNFQGREADASSYSMQELFAIDATRTALNDLLNTDIPFDFFLQPNNLVLIGEILNGNVAAINKLIEALKGLEETENKDFGKEGGLLTLGDETIEKYQKNRESQREERRSKAGVSDLVLEDTADEILANDKALQKLEDQFDDTAEEAEEFREQLEDIAATVVIQEKSYKTLRKSLDKYNDLLEDTEATSVDFKEANAEIAEALQGIFGDSIDLDFVDKYRDKIEAFAQGGEEAVNAFHDLQAAAQQEYILELQATLTGDDETRANLQALLDEATYVDANGDIHLNADLDISSYVATLNDMIAKSQITMETANGLLRSIGYEAITGFDFIPTPDTAIHNSGSVKMFGRSLLEWNYDQSQTGQIAVPRIIGTTPIGAPKSMSSSRPKSSGGRGGGGGGSKKTPSKPSTEKPRGEDTDPFHDINIKIQKLGENYEELEDKRDNLLGDDLVDNLNKELSVLEKQNEAYREKLRIAELLKRVQQEELTKQGVEFSADGQISNYEAIINARLNALNDMINKYNNMSAEEQEAYEGTLEKAQDDYDKLLEAIEKYEELINDTVPEVQQELRDNLNEKIEIEMEKFKLAVDVRLNTSEAQREWNEFKNKVIKELDDENILGNAKANIEDIFSYYDTGAVQAVSEQIRNTIIELNNLNSIGWSGIYGDNHTQALEDLKAYTDELKNQLESIKDLTDEVNESVLDTIDKIKDDFDEQINAYGQVSDLIQHDMRVIELLYGEDEYGALGEFYDKQAESNKSQIEFLRMQTEFWRQQMTRTDPGTEAWDAIKENYQDSLSNLNNALEDALQNMIDKYTNAINDIFDKLEDKVTDGLGLDYVGEEWDLINQNADQYLDTINAAYAIQDSQQKYLDAINESADPAVQQRLNDLMNDQLKILREKEKITQYDVDRANMMLDIELKRIALEEQQQNKTKLRLRRDTQGNYTYQYVTDEDNIAAAREELAAAQNDLYNFDKSQYQNTLDEMYNTYQEFQQKMLAIYEDTTMTDEERERQKALIIEQYGQLINNMTAENAQIRKNLEESAFTDLADIYDTNVELYQNMTQQEKDILLSDLVPAWDSGIQHMIDTFVSEGGFVPTCIESFEKLNQAMQEYKGNVESIAGTAGLNTDDLQQGIDVTIAAAEQLTGVNDQLIDAANQEMTAIRDIISELNNLIAKYTEAKNAAVDAVNSGFSAYQKDQHQNALGYVQDPLSGSTWNNTSSVASNGLTDPNLPGVGQRMRYLSGRIYATPNGDEPSSSMAGGQEVVVTQVQPGARKPYRVALNGQILGWLDKDQLARFKSGGYTGEWGDSGKLAILDQKELVLEQDDTKNILTAVDIVRSISNMLDDITTDRLSILSSGIGNVFKDFPPMTETIEQQVHIDASFPNVTSSDEIQNAFNNLVNVAAQRAMNSNR